ncbi:MAG: Scr1 family TA system antitoxin-like transcriptional regulator, partial [Trebonia sp.]
MPSYKNLQQLSEQALRHRRPDGAELLPLTKSTAHSMLSGRVVRPPRWQVVLTFVTVLHAAARKAGIDPARIGTVDEWKRRHEALCAAEQAARRPVASHGKHAKPSSDRVAPLEAVMHWARRDSEERDFKEDVVFGEVLGLVRRAGGPQWWHDYHDVVPEWLELNLYLESAASIVRVYATHAIPELLQVEGYARTMLSMLIPDAPVQEITRLT